MTKYTETGVARHGHWFAAANFYVLLQLATSPGRAHGLLAGLHPKQPWQARLPPDAKQLYFFPAPLKSWRRKLSQGLSIPTTRDAHSESSDNTVSETENDGWAPGDVEADLNLLRMSIAESRADIDRATKERIALSEHFARGRRPLFRDLLKFVVGPAALAAWLSSTLMREHFCANNGVCVRGARLFVTLMNVQYYSTILSSFSFLLAKKILLHKKSKYSPPVRGSQWDMDYENPKTSCRDHVLCLLENLASSVVGAASLGLIYCISALSGRYTVGIKEPPGTNAVRALVIANVASRFLNRLGAMAALNQYPELLYQLQRADQPRPLSAFTDLLQKLVKFLILVLPFGVASDVASLWLAVRCVDGTSLLGSASQFLCIQPKAVVAASTICPIIHIIALLRILVVRFFSDIALLSPSNRSYYTLKRRYWLRWRTPKRLSVVLRKWWRDDFILRGRGPLSDESYRYDTPPINFADSYVGGTSVLFDQRYRDHELDLPILQRIADDEERGFFDGRPSRSEWPKMATKRLATKHQRNFEQKNFEDPLGIAVQQTFGIGLNYDFDYDVHVRKGAKPSAHILRARAARSAIRHCRDLEGSMSVQINHVEDPQERMQLGSNLSRQLSAEKRRLAKELLELVPTHAGVPDGRNIDSIQAMSESDANALLREKPPLNEPGSYVTTYGKNPQWGEAEDPFLDQDYVNDLLRLSKRRIDAEKSGDDSLPQNQEANLADEDDFVSTWINLQYGDDTADPDTVVV